VPAAAPQPGRFEVRVGPGDQGQRLDVFLSRRFRYSRTRLRLRYREGILAADGRPLRWSHRLRKDELLLVPVRDRPELPVPVEYSLLYRDEWLVAVDKGSGAPVHPTRSFQTRTVLTKLRQELELPELKLAHRLDRETSGVLLCGATVPVLTHLMRQFASRQVRKRYLAVVRGVPAFARQTVDLPLRLDLNFPLRTRMIVDREGGQPARTEFEVLERRVDRALVAAVPQTGRQHQIRIHLAEIGHPVLGDKLYQEGGRPYLAMFKDALGEADYARLGHHRHALHAERLEFTHPITGQRMTLVAPLPRDLVDVLG
jgi:23S rRNA pseudouridine1911/1915/1917 synthase